MKTFGKLTTITGCAIMGFAIHAMSPPVAWLFCGFSIMSGGLLITLAALMAEAKQAEAERRKRKGLHF